MDVETQLQLLRQIAYFRAVPLENMAGVARALRIRRFKNGEVIFRRGDACEGLHIIFRARTNSHRFR